MSRPDLFTYTGALRVLGRYERPLFDKVDVALGGAILLGGALGAPDVLGLIDPKNEAMSSLRKVLDKVSARLTGLSGAHRQELVAAAHTVIAVNSVFDAFRDQVGDRFDLLRVTDAEKFRALGVEPTGSTEAGALPALSELNVPAPDATRGFQQNLDGPLSTFFSAATAAVAEFLGGLAAWQALAGGRDLVVPSLVVERSREQYVHHFLGLAASIPEFEVWTFIGEHSATRAAVEAGNDRLARALAAQTESLERFARLLARSAPGQLGPDRSYRAKLEKAALATLGKPLLRTNPDTQPVNARFPSVERGFVAPGYRVTVHDEKSVPSSEEWWSSNTVVEEDIDAFLAAHLASPTSTARPLLVLGHPGAGKSLLMEVLAARLPAAGYTVVNVQLRKVDADDSVRGQIETALTDVLAEKVDWGRLADECGDSIRVVLLDGFDELVQASGVTQSNYLRQVLDFQEREADLGRPVAVVITSRTLVVDRARIPHGVPIVKLEEFDDARIGKWLDAWNRANATTPGFRPPTPADLLRHGDLARQPLILLMLAIYAADTGSRPDDEDLSPAELYERLIDSFVVRQARDKGRVQPSAAQVAKRVKQSKWQLGITALAMFNRGRQYVEDAELKRDLAPFAPPPEVVQRTTFDDPLDTTDRIVGDFFFIHSAQVNQRDDAAGRRRTYEFLHATFGEYLIAEVTVKLLLAILDDRARRESQPFEDFGLLDDARLFALISHQAFTKRPPVLDFAAGLFGALDGEVRAGLVDVLDELIRSVHHRVKHDRYPTYDPSGATLVTRVAAYSANLVCLRVHLDGSPVPLDSLFGELREWQSMVHLWHSGLDADGWESLVDTLTLDHHEDARFITLRDDDGVGEHVAAARLVGDATLEGAIRAGTYFVDNDVTSRRAEQELLSELSRWIMWNTGMSNQRITLPFDVRALDRILDRLDAGVPLNRRAHSMLLFALSRESWRLPTETVSRAIRLLVLGSGYGNASEMCSTVCAHPRLLDEVSGLVEHLVDAVIADPASRLTCLVIAWRANETTGDRFKGLRRLVDRFNRLARRIEDGKWVDAYFPVEFYDYLSASLASNWAFDRKLLEELRRTSAKVLGLVAPRPFYEVAKRFMAGSAPEQDILDFVHEYAYHAHGVSEPYEDLPAAMLALKRMAEG
ncbi:NACHT domain-containing protein [Actinosynnema sp. NPDC059335]|uniref:NACHT domain-containing protein n=1 Tax=Actinosynnema sp. NPDC059335 TaxID=3346804 RepID=UPI00366C3D8E